MSRELVLVHTLFIFFGLLPALFAFMEMKRGKLTPSKFLGFGVGLVAVGTLVIFIGTDLLQVVQKYIQPDNPDYNSAKEIALHVGVWAYVFPAVSIGIGVNLLTEYLISGSTPKNATLTTGSRRRRR